MSATLWRVVPLDPRAADGEPGGALHCPRARQGAGRHDDPEHHGCLYLSESPVSSIAETLAPFRGTGRLRPPMLARSGRPLALVELRGDDALELVDLDNPSVLVREALHPSQVATRVRPVTQRIATTLADVSPAADGLRWWSTLEASFINVTLFDRGLPRLRVVASTPLRLGLPEVDEAAAVLGLRIA